MFATYFLLVSAVIASGNAMKCHSRHFDQLVDTVMGQRWVEVWPEGSNQYTWESQCSVYEQANGGHCTTVIVTDKLIEPPRRSSNRNNEIRDIVTTASVKQACCDPPAPNQKQPNWACDRAGARHSERMLGGTLTVLCENMGSFMRKKVTFDCPSELCQLPQHEWQRLGEQYWDRC